MTQHTGAAAQEAKAADKGTDAADGSLITGRSRDLGGFSVRRILPSAKRQMVGPFIFFDHLGPLALPPGRGLDVAPHPHIGLATVTYLFEGELVHRDSLATVQPIRPGAVNWMIAGRGIVHSERSDTKDRVIGPRLHGIQAWVALPAADAETQPSFHHHPPESLPTIERDGATMRLIAGTAFGARSPAPAFSPLFYLDAVLAPGAAAPLPDDHQERAIYVVAGCLADGPIRIEPGSMLIVRPGAVSDIRAECHSRVMVLGGAPLAEPRHVWWNFVALSRERIERAKSDWSGGRFATIPGEHGAIALPER